MIFWTPEADAVLIAAWPDLTQSAARIAKDLPGKTKNAVVGRASRLHLEPRRASRVTAFHDPDRPPSGPRKPRAYSAHRVQRAEKVANYKSGIVGEDIGGPETHVEILDLGPDQCKWPIGDPKTPEFRYCGAPRCGLGPYCAGHSRLACEPRRPHRPPPRE